MSTCAMLHHGTTQISALTVLQLASLDWTALIETRRGRLGPVCVPAFADLISNLGRPTKGQRMLLQNVATQLRDHLNTQDLDSIFLEF